jgi:hypothetical protein
MFDLLFVHVGDPDKDPNGKLILFPAWRFYRFFEHCQQRRQWKEALLQTARREL